MCAFALSIFESLSTFLRLNSRTEEVLARLLETSMGDGGVEVDTLEESVKFDGHLGGRGECSLCTFTSGAETVESRTLVLRCKVEREVR